MIGHLSYRCDWVAKTEVPVKEIPQHLPFHLRKRIKHKPLPKYFEVDPPSGILPPGQTHDIRVRFMPTEEVRTLLTHSLTQ